MRRTAVISWATAAAAITSLAVAAPATSQEQRATFPQLVKQGQALAEKLCQNCHVVEAAPNVVVPAGVPTMRGIANRPGQTAERLKSIMLNPHPPMPDVKLSYPEVDQILAFLESLRTQGDKQLHPRQPDKPLYPDPS